MIPHPQVTICVPARNEAAHLPRLLSALAAQTYSATVLIALNNATDKSREVIERHGTDLNITIDETVFPAELAHAGSARRRAMDLGAKLSGEGGILITTDADARPPPEWVAENVAALQSGLDIVGGRICLDDDENIAVPIRAMVAISDRYWAQVRTIEDSIDPVPWDPPPRHGDHTGASLALSVRQYLQSGGVPLLRSGEDRALVQAVCIRGGKLGHPWSVWTRVSARTKGRAENGMAEAMARLSNASCGGDPVMLPDLRHWEERARWRKTIRTQYGSAEVAAREAALPPLPCDRPLSLSVADICENA